MTSISPNERPNCEEILLKKENLILNEVEIMMIHDTFSKFNLTMINEVLNSNDSQTYIVMKFIYTKFNSDLNHAEKTSEFIC
jgi:hypothetical protein